MLPTRIRLEKSFKMAWSRAHSAKPYDSHRPATTQFTQLPSALSRCPALIRSACVRSFGGHVDDSQLLEFALEIYAELHGASARPPLDFIVPSDDDIWPHILRGFALGLHASRSQSSDRAALRVPTIKDPKIRDMTVGKPAATEILK